MGRSYFSYSEGTTMDGQNKSRWAASLGLTGDRDYVHFQLLMERYEGLEATGDTLKHAASFPLDGDPYSPAEWIREVLMGVVEYF